MQLLQGQSEHFDDAKTFQQASFQYIEPPFLYTEVNRSENRVVEEVFTSTYLLPPDFRLLEE